MNAIELFESRELDIAESHIVDCISCFPSLFKNRFSVLEHIFLTIGNGYRWDEELQMPVICETLEYKMDKICARYIASSMFDDTVIGSLYPESSYANLHKVNKNTDQAWIKQAVEFSQACLALEDEWKYIGQLKSRLSCLTAFNQPSEGTDSLNNYLKWKPHFERIVLLGKR